MSAQFANTTVRGQREGTRTHRQSGTASAREYVLPVTQDTCQDEKRIGIEPLADSSDRRRAEGRNKWRVFLNEEHSVKRFERVEANRC